jgi:BolA protein
MSVERTLRERLAVLDPARLDIVDDSERHAGHAGAAGGGKHFRISIVSAHFAGRSRLARQRLVIDAAGDLMQGAIHALSINAKAPGEV